MALMSMFILLTLATVEVMVVTGETGSEMSRQKRSDDGGPLEAVVEHLSQQVTTLNAQMTALQAITGTLDKTVAFYVWNDANPLQVVAHGTLIFSHVATNIGNSYDKDTGFFTAPLSGLYDFQASILRYHTSAQGVVHAGIYVDNHLVAIGVSDNRGGTNYVQAAMRVIIHVNAGSKVALKNVDSTSSVYYVTSSEPYTTFSGFLIKAD